MASLRKHKDSKFWFACYCLPGGKRVQRTTKESNRKKAQQLADKLEAAARSRMSARQAHRMIAEIYQAATGEHLPASTVKSHFDNWLAKKKAETSRATHIFYDGKVRSFLAFLGPKADGPLTDISSADVIAFRAALAQRLSPASVNHAVKFLRMVFEDAKRDNLVAENPAESVKTVKKSVERSRRPFTLDELKVVLGVANDEWRSLILFGLYTGQRLIDLARMTWNNIDLVSNEIRLVPSKTGRTVLIPIASPLLQHIESLSATDNPDQPVHRYACEVLEKQGKSGTLSRQFYELLVKAGLAAKKTHRKRTDTEDNRREMSPITFHSLRHTATSLMKNAGVSPAIVQDIIGHESSAISANYTHIEKAAKKLALATLPNLHQL